MNCKVAVGLVLAAARSSNTVIFYEEPAKVRAQVQRLVRQPAYLMRRS
jgi:hypothetical protein